MLRHKKVVLLGVLILIIGGFLVFGLGKKTFEVNDHVNGFVLKEKQVVKSVTGGVAYLFEHEKTKGQVLYVKNDDSHKTFSIFFKAPTTDSTGVSHIMEHSVLAGSNKFRGKDPFFEYFQTSPHSFMNAMTWQDMVWYPFSTQYDQNFSDLMDIYLDSVFHPLLKKETFMREGWRYTFDEKDNLGVNGIVYNEMKHAYASVGRQLYMKGLKSLFGKYNCSGGNPVHVPDLTYEAFKAYHDKYYHPSNSLAYFYGDGDIASHLEKLNAVYQGYSYEKPAEINVPKVKKERVVSTYPAAKGETKSYASWFYSLGRSDDFVMEAKADSLKYLLVGYEDAPLKADIVQAGYANDIDIDVWAIQGHLIMMVYAEGISPQHVKKIESIYAKSLKKIVEKGFSDKSVRAAISTAQFKLFHRVDNEGLDMSDEALRPFLRNTSLFSFLNKEDIFAQYKKDLSKPDAFESIVQDLMVKTSPSFVLLKPDAQWTVKEESKLADRLKKVQKGFSSEALKRVKSSLDEFKESEKNPEAATTLPNMSSSAMPKTLGVIPTKLAKIGDVEFFYHPLVSKGENVAVRVYFDLETVSKDLIPYVGLYMEIADKFAPEGVALSDFIFDQKIAIGRTFDFWDDVALSYQPKEFSAKVGIGGEILSDSIPQALHISEQILFQLDFSDKAKVKAVLERLLSEKEMAYRQHGYPLLRQSSAMKSFDDLFSGFGFYLFLKDVVANFDRDYDMIISQFKRIRKTVFTSSALTLSVVAPEDNYDAVLKATTAFTQKLPVGDLEHKVVSYPVYLSNQASIIPARTQENTLVMRVFDVKSMKDYAGWSMMANVLRGEYLLPEIRFK
ncbi:MAG: insulinase family protein, partial [Alphaproteobacteria bacterium]|nr:insulinase family protein [Alphaproteobacteria bacterium]